MINSTSKIEAVANALMAKYNEIETGMRSYNAKVYASVAIDAINEWDREHPNRVYTAKAEAVNKAMVEGSSDINWDGEYIKADAIEVDQNEVEETLKPKRPWLSDRSILEQRLINLEDFNRVMHGRVNSLEQRASQLEAVNSAMHSRINEFEAVQRNHGNRLGKLELAPWSEKEFNKRLDKLVALMNK